MFLKNLSFHLFYRCPHSQNCITSPTLVPRDRQNKLWASACPVQSKKTCFQPVCIWNFLQCEYLCVCPLRYWVMLAERTALCHKAQCFVVSGLYLGLCHWSSDPLWYKMCLWNLVSAPQLFKSMCTTDFYKICTDQCFLGVDKCWYLKFQL